MTSAKSLTKTAVLDASDDPKDQDKARERRVKMDFASWRKQTKAGKKTHQEEVGISSAVAMKKAREEAKRKLIQDKAVAKQKAAFGDSDKQVKEAKADTGSATEKATARNKRNTPAGKDYDFDNKVFITRKPGESLDSARTRTRQKAHAAKRGVKKEEVEVQEKTLDTFEKNKKEDIVKGMKKSSKDLKKRYGSKWKNEMYATATKKAKEAGDTSKSDERYASESRILSLVQELNRYGKETGKATGSLNKRPGSKIKPKGDEPGALRNVRGMIRKETGKPEGQKRRDYDERGKGQDRRETPKQTVTKRRERQARADAAMRDTSGT